MYFPLRSKPMSFIQTTSNRYHCPKYPARPILNHLQSSARMFSEYHSGYYHLKVSVFVICTFSFPFSVNTIILKDNMPITK